METILLQNLFTKDKRICSVMSDLKKAKTNWLKTDERWLFLLAEWLCRSEAWYWRLPSHNVLVQILQPPPEIVAGPFEKSVLFNNVMNNTGLE